MPTPQILNDIIRLLLQLMPAMALVCLALAGIALRTEGGSTFVIGGNFTRWALWAVIMLSLPQLLLWFNFFGLPVPLAGGDGQQKAGFAHFALPRRPGQCLYAGHKFPSTSCYSLSVSFDP